MATVWQRPKSIDFPKVWKIFKGLREIDGKVPEFWIQDIPEEEFDTVIDMMVEKFVEELSSIMEARDFWRKLLKQRLSLVCLVQSIYELIEIVSISINCRTTPNDPKTSFQGIELASASLLRQYVVQKNNFYEQFNVGEVITGMGGFTVSEYHSQNVCVEMFKCRELLCKTTGIKMTLVITTADWQEDLEREGFKHYTTVTSQELNKISEAPIIPDGQCFKLLYNCYE